MTLDITNLSFREMTQDTCPAPETTQTCCTRNIFSFKAFNFQKNENSERHVQSRTEVDTNKERYLGI